MPHTMSSTWPTLEIQTSGRLGFDEQNEILSSVVEILRAAPAFGHRVGEALKPFEKVFVAIFVGNEARVAPLVDVSVMIAKKLGVRISTFNDFDRLVLQTSRHLTDLI